MFIIMFHNNVSSTILNSSIPTTTVLHLLCLFFLLMKSQPLTSLIHSLSSIGNFSQFHDNYSCPSLSLPFSYKRVGMISNIPQWLEILLGEKFFMPCMVHKYTKKKEKNVFCLDCCTSLCPHCLPPHRHHSLLQIRRYVYRDVIQLGDAQKLIDCSLVQTYTTNSAKVVFLNQRPMSRPFRASGNLCIKCDRSLQDSFHFCSLFCKVYHLVTMKNGTHLEKLHNCEFLRLPNRTKSESFSELEDNQNVSLSGSTSNTIGGVSSESFRTILSCSAATKFVKKKRISLNSLPSVFSQQICSPADDVAVAMNRRKGIPYRSPLY